MRHQCVMPCSVKNTRQEKLLFDTLQTVAKTVFSLLLSPQPITPFYKCTHHGIDESFFTQHFDGTVSQLYLYDILSCFSLVHITPVAVIA